jgi:hypothetical protein
MLIHRQNSYVPRGRRFTGHREAQSREPVNEVKKKLSYELRRDVSLTKPVFTEVLHICNKNISYVYCLLVRLYVIQTNVQIIKTFDKG